MIKKGAVHCFVLTYMYSKLGSSYRLYYLCSGTYMSDVAGIYVDLTNCHMWHLRVCQFLSCTWQEHDTIAFVMLMIV